MALHVLGVFITHIIVFMVDLASIPVLSAQIICCFVPPIALQLGARSFLKSYDGLPLSAICGIMVRLLACITPLHFLF